MVKTCQHQGCSNSSDFLISYSSSYISDSDDKAINAGACDEHEQDLWRYFEQHEHYYPIEKAQV